MFEPAEHGSEDGYERRVGGFQRRSGAPPGPPRWRPQMIISEPCQCHPLPMHGIEMAGGFGKKCLTADIDIDPGENAQVKKRPKAGPFGGGHERLRVPSLLRDTRASRGNGRPLSDVQLRNASGISVEKH